MQMLRSVLAAAALAAQAAVALAQTPAPTPVGLWKTVDDQTQKEKSLVRITELGGVFTGQIEKLLDPARQDVKCEQCNGDLKDKPVLGLKIIHGIKKSEDEGLWDGGTILDPHNGKTYKVRLKPVEGGAKLEVRGYVGTPLLGRTQVWQRVE